MGLFDYVNVSMPCPECGTMLPEFQSKDRVCQMETVEPDALMNFYTNCQQCKEWIQFARPSAPIRPHRSTPYTREEVEAMGFVHIKRE